MPPARSLHTPDTPPPHTHNPPPPPRSGLNIYCVNELLAARGWHLNALQRPPALHICLTAAHSPKVVGLLLRDLRCRGALALPPLASPVGSWLGRWRGGVHQPTHSIHPRTLPRACRECVEAALLDPKAGDEGNAPLYGMAAAVPDRRIVGQFLVAYQDCLLEAL